MSRVQCPELAHNYYERNVWLARLAIDRWQLAERINPAPFALVSEVAQGLRIAAPNAAAREQGVRTGAMLTDARAVCPGLAVAPGDPAGDPAGDLAGDPAPDRDTRPGRPGYALHRELEEVALSATEALLTARAPGWLPAFYRWLEQFNPELALQPAQEGAVEAQPGV